MKYKTIRQKGEMSSDKGSDIWDIIKVDNSPFAMVTLFIFIIIILIFLMTKIYI